VAKYVVDLLNQEGVELVFDPDFDPKREGIKKFSQLSWSEKEELKQKDSKYGQLICRCEEVTEAEIVAAINRPLGATTLDGIKRRVRPGAGRCQGGFCKPRVLKIISRELDIPVSEILKKEKGSKVISRSKI
ncbi:MAG: FAD/NAD(P)-binding oxidoreductase, partial [Halanaerobium sp. MSAO_Bac5]